MISNLPSMFFLHPDPPRDPYFNSYRSIIGLTIGASIQGAGVTCLAFAAIEAASGGLPLVVVGEAATVGLAVLVSGVVIEALLVYGVTYFVVGTWNTAKKITKTVVCLLTPLPKLAVVAAQIFNCKESLFYQAIKDNNKELAEALIKAGVDLNRTFLEEEGSWKYAKLLAFACKKKHFEIADLIVDAMSDEKYLTFSLPHSLILAALEGEEDLARKIYEKGINNRFLESWVSKNALVDALKRGEIKKVEFLFSLCENLSTSHKVLKIALEKGKTDFSINYINSMKSAFSNDYFHDFFKTVPTVEDLKFLLSIELEEDLVSKYVVKRYYSGPSVGGGGTLLDYLNANRMAEHLELINNHIEE